MEHSSSSVIYKKDNSGNDILNPRLVFILATACGITVANLYWAQPLLDTIAKTYGNSVSTAGMIVTFTQIGYATGLIFIVPLGDLFERKKLILSILFLIAFALMSAAFSPSIEIFILSSLIIGITSVVAQILVPFAATLAKDHERGKVVGQVMSGLLLGILLARTLAGFISEIAGWRAVFIVAALLILIQTFILKEYLPSFKEKVNLSYFKLLNSVIKLIRKERVIRVRSFYGALVFAMFSVLWTSLTFLLAGPVYKFSDAAIGLFGLVGAAGAFSANIAGRLADKGREKYSTLFFLMLNLIAFSFMLGGENNIYMLIIGIILLDAGVQGTHITNQSEIYKLDPQARSRITTAYMASFFIGGSIGSASSAVVFEQFGWPGVCYLGLSYSVFSVFFWIWDKIIYPQK